MQWYLFVLGSLAVWRITHLLQAEDGPFDIIYLIRKKAGAGFFGNLLDCFYCTSIWVALPAAFYISKDRKEIVLLWIAFSGAACLLERLTASSNHHSKK